ncbi:MAG: hypothetical protein Q8J76_00495, partial [Desulfobulbaceae bacterium]|nr:hypothetical protein [Desulfobulbaceae bacterium]
AFAECGNLLTTDDPLIIQGKLQQDERGAKIIADSVDSLDDARRKFTEKATLVLDGDHLTRAGCETLKKTLQEFYGDCPVGMTVHFPGRGEVDISFAKDMTIKPCLELRQQIKASETNSQILYTIKKVELRNQNGKGKWQRNGSG